MDDIVQFWSNISLRDVEFKPQEEKLAIQGDIQIFVLYEAEGEDRAIRSYETTLPLNGSLECQGCREDLLPDIRYTLLRQEPGQQTLTIQPDLDGEERILGMECALELNIRLYEEEQIDILRDIYGVKNEVIPDTRQASVRQLLTRITGKTKITDHAGTNIDGPILQILHSEGTASIDHRDITEDGIRLQGSIHSRYSVFRSVPVIDESCSSLCNICRSDRQNICSLHDPLSWSCQ